MNGKRIRMWGAGLLLAAVSAAAQDYAELPDPDRPDEAAWGRVKGVQVSWGSIDARYAKSAVPAVKKTQRQTLSGWRGERVMAQAVVWSRTGCPGLSYQVTDWTGAAGTIPSGAAETGFVRCVMTDGLNPDGGGCGARPDPSLFDSLLVADCIDSHLRRMDLPPMQAQAIWVSVEIPRSAPSGLYQGKLLILSEDRVIEALRLDLRVDRRTLPEEMGFHLDLWQNPYAVARYEQVPLWSEAHLEAMRPLMQRLARAGQKVITASIIHRPWDGQTEDPFSSMVTWVKRLDGSWEFGYDVFDRWTEFMMSCGISRQINCFSMAPWRLSFRYFDQRTDSMQEIRCAPGDEAYREMWTAMLRSFSRHLREKGWFDRCCIAMDERPLDMMQKTLSVIFAADPEFKVALAGNYYGEIEPFLYDYCIPLGEDFPEPVLLERKRRGFLSTVYTSCSQGHPNTFTFSDPAEAAEIGYQISAKGLDGFLRWAYNSWPRDPLRDSRFRTWAAGDTYLVYPGNRSSIRFERLIQGIQACEKSRIESGF